MLESVCNIMPIYWHAPDCTSMSEYQCTIMEGLKNSMLFNIRFLVWLSEMHIGLVKLQKKSIYQTLQKIRCCLCKILLNCAFRQPRKPYTLMYSWICVFMSLFFFFVISWSLVCSVVWKKMEITTSAAIISFYYAFSSRL